MKRFTSPGHAQRFLSAFSRGAVGRANIDGTCGVGCSSATEVPRAAVAPGVDDDQPIFSDRFCGITRARIDPGGLD